MDAREREHHAWQHALRGDHANVINFLAGPWMIMNSTSGYFFVILLGKPTRTLTTTLIRLLLPMMEEKEEKEEGRRTPPTCGDSSVEKWHARLEKVLRRFQDGKPFITLWGGILVHSHFSQSL